ncbi:hypothetical protein GCM10025785_07810 [Corynebacterium canis]
MLQAAYGSLTMGMDIQPRDRILIRGGTSPVGMAAAVLAKQISNVVVLSTTRNPDKSYLANLPAVVRLTVYAGEACGKLVVETMCGGAARSPLIVEELLGWRLQAFGWRRVKRLR